MLATARLEGNGNEWGDRTASTLIAVSSPPFKQWSYAKSQVTRLDGPCLFPYNGRLYSIGRYQATVAKVQNYEPNRIPRMWDVWFN